MGGCGMLQYIPLAKSALEYDKEKILSWFSSWLRDDELQVLKTGSPRVMELMCNQEGIQIPEGVTDGTFLWTPPPAAAGVTTEELGLSRHKLHPFAIAVDDVEKEIAQAG